MAAPRPAVVFGPAIEEAGLWQDFHHMFLATFREHLARGLPDRYAVILEERVYVAWEEPPPAPYRPDASVVARERPATYGAGASTPVLCTLPVADRVTEAFLEVRTAEGQLVTVVELLSPNNKKPGHAGREAYLTKRRAVLQSAVHLVEIDLLAGGQRMPLAGEWPPGDGHVLVARGNRRPVAEVYPWHAGQALPTIALPLLAPDPDVPVNLQEVFETTWQRGRYDRLLDHARKRPPG